MSSSFRAAVIFTGILSSASGHAWAGDALALTQEIRKLDQRTAEAANEWGASMKVQITLELTPRANRIWEGSAGIAQAAVLQSDLEATLKQVQGYRLLIDDARAQVLKQYKGSSENAKNAFVWYRKFTQRVEKRIDLKNQLKEDGLDEVASRCSWEVLGKDASPVVKSACGELIRIQGISEKFDRQKALQDWKYAVEREESDYRAWTKKNKDLLAAVDYYPSQIRRLTQKALMADVSYQSFLLTQNAKGSSGASKTSEDSRISARREVPAIGLRPASGPIDARTSSSAGADR